MKNKYETAIIFKKKIDNNENIEFIPVNIIKGFYNETQETFIDEDGTFYYNILENPDNYGFGYRNYIDNYKNRYPLLKKELIMKIVFSMIKKNIFTYNIDNETNSPIIMLSNKNDNTEQIILLDEDMKKIYRNKYPLFNQKYIENTNEEKSVINKEEININEIYSDLTNKVIDQENPIKEILTVIWKQLNNDNNKSRSILIRGNTAVGKTKILREISTKLNIPYFITTPDYTCSQYNGKCIEGMLFELLKTSNFDEEKASRGILIIDKCETIPEVNKYNNIINDLLKIIDGETFTLSLNIGNYKIDTSKLMIICLLNPNKLEIITKNNIGFIKEEKKEIKIYEEIVDKFTNIIQMNELNQESYFKILRSKYGTLNSNKMLLKENGISLKIKNGTMKEISERVTPRKGVRSLDEIIETALLEASFEIANNPNKYSELIISPETIKDNKNYTLIKRKD